MQIKKLIHKEADIIPILLSLFFIPVFFNPSFIFSFTQGKELLFKLIIVLAIIFFLKKKKEINNIKNSSLLLIILIQAFIFAITDIFSKTPIVSLYGTYSRGFGYIMELFILIFTIYTAFFLSESRIKKLLKVSFFSASIVAVFGLIQWLGFDFIFNNYDTGIFQKRIFSFLGNPSYLGQFLLLTSIVGVYFAITEKKKRIVYISTTILILLALILSGTRTAMLGGAFAAVIFSIKYYRRINSFIRHNKVITSSLVIVVICLTTLLPNSRYSMSSTALRSLNSRFEIWSGTIELIKERPLIGYGGETFYIHFPEIINKQFLALEENININADRVHNETLEVLFSHGVFGMLVYILLFFSVLRIFFKTQNHLESILAAIVIVNIFQNQLSFSDITISLLIAFCMGGLIFFQCKNNKKIHIKKYISLPIVIALGIIVGYFVIYTPYVSQLNYTKSKHYHEVDYVVAVNSLKKSLEYTPYYSELWYELMFIDPSSMERAIYYLEKIEGKSGNLLAWKGNLYAKDDPKKASSFYIEALKKNPYNPNWIRAFADMLYDNEDYEDALYLYNKYLESIPDYWKSQNSLVEEQSYETMLKHTPYFEGILKKIERITEILQKDSVVIN